MKTPEEINELYDELIAIMERRWPPNEFGEDYDLSSIEYLAMSLRDIALEAIKEKAQ
jgi:hypothetical protein